MHMISGRNVNHNYAAAVAHLYEFGQRKESRAGDVLVAPYPVVTVTNNPWERVHFDAERDANPFFHFFECLWMMSGSRDARWLDRFVGDFSSRFAEKGGLQWGAYGHRWREHFKIDQLNETVKRLRANPDDRRVVIGMWDPVQDLFLAPESVRDLPCNLQMIPRIVNGALDLTITNRSNDLVWGCYGANAVHMSFVQEYLAARIGVRVGRMYQMSNNWHGYVSTLPDAAPKVNDPYVTGAVSSSPIVTPGCEEFWDNDLTVFMDSLDDEPQYHNALFSQVAAPMMKVHTLWKAGERDEAQHQSNSIRASDWRLAVQSWMTRRMK